MDNNKNPPYEERDDAIMAGHIFNELCILDREDRNVGIPPAWHDITQLAEKVRAFDKSVDVAYIAETNLLDQQDFIERDPHNQNVRLTQVGRQNCGKGINIPPSSNQLRVKL
jgi:hypothetical protein